MYERLAHDLGGLDAGPIDRTSHDRAFWEQRLDAMMALLSDRNRAGGPVLRVDELRRAIESLGADAYERLDYYERWISAISQVLLEKGVITVDELATRLQDIERRDGAHA